MIIVRGLAGAFVGGVVGYLAFFWLLQHGLHVAPVPGALLGIGAGLGRGRSLALAIISALLALLLGLYAQWGLTILPELSSSGILRFVTGLPVRTMLALLLGAFLGFWLPYHRRPLSGG